MMNVKRLTAALLALLMLLALTGCGEKEDTAPDTGTQTPAPAPTPTPTPEPSPAPAPTPDPEPNIPAQPDSPALPTPVVSGGDLQPTPDPDLRPEIQNDIDSLRAICETALLYIAQYHSYDAAAQKAEEDLLTENIQLVLEMQDNLAHIGTMELTPAEQQYLTEAEGLLAGLMEPWLPLFEAYREPAAPSYTLPQTMLDKIAALEQMYADTYTFMSTGAAAIYGRITDYESYQYNQEALAGFYDTLFDRCILQDPDTLIQTACQYYTEAAKLTADERDYAMKLFYDRVLGARVACIDKFWAEDCSVTYYNSCYIHFIIDDWQGSTPPDQWAAAKIAAQDEFYRYSDLLGATDVRDFHQKVTDGFARGDFDVYNLMGVKS